MKACDSAMVTCPTTGMTYPDWRFFTPDYLASFVGASCGILFFYYIYSLLKNYLRDKKAAKTSTAVRQTPDLGRQASRRSSVEDKGPLRMDIEFKKLGLELHGSRRKVLNGVTGSILSGRITACMGPSGAGKTTFMNVLAGKATYGTMTGQIEINGRPDSVLNYSTLVGFVPQEDTMLRDLTVRENLSFYARIRLPASYSNARCETIVDETIGTLGLSHIQHSRIGDETKRGISGGQRKRVNVGMEMVSSPSLLFLDEPTSGLDSTTSYDLLEALHVLAKKGTNILVVLHQPSYQLFQLFDDVLLLGKGGSTVYLGESRGALDYFQGLGFVCGDRMNPADFFMDVIAGKVERTNDEGFQPEDLFDMWVQNQKALKREKKRSQQAIGMGSIYESGSTLDDVTVVTSRSRITREHLAVVAPAQFWHSLWLFSKRAVLQYRKGKMTFLGDLVMQFVAGLVIGSLYHNFTFVKLPSMNFMTTMVLGLTTGLATLRPFGLEREVFWREASPGSGMSLDTLAYFMAKTIVEIPRIGLLTFAILCTFYPLANPQTSFVNYYFLCFAGTFMATGIPLIFSVSMDVSICIVLYWFGVKSFCIGFGRFCVLLSFPVLCPVGLGLGQQLRCEQVVFGCFRSFLGDLGHFVVHMVCSSFYPVSAPAALLSAFARNSPLFKQYLFLYCMVISAPSRPFISSFTRYFGS